MSIVALEVLDIATQKLYSYDSSRNTSPFKVLILAINGLRILEDHF